MIQLEKEIESAVRTGIRTSLNTYGSATPELVDAKIIGGWVGAEDGGAVPDASGLRVLINCGTNGFDGWIPGVGPVPIRDVSLEVVCVSQPDSDTDRRVVQALYHAVREVFEVAPFPAAFAQGITHHGHNIRPGTNGFSEDGHTISFTVELKVSL